MIQASLKIPEANFSLLSQLLETLGGKVSEKKTSKELNQSTIKVDSDEDVSPTYLFGKWKDMDINPKTWRRKVWRRKR
ncbi:MAG: hypothetical protein ABI723_02350 [Bacteroidia bacterium]